MGLTAEKIIEEQKANPKITMQEIADKYGCTRGNVFYFAKKAGLKFEGNTGRGGGSAGFYLRRENKQKLSEVMEEQGLNFSEAVNKAIEEL